MGIRWIDLSDKQRALVADPTISSERSKIDSGAFFGAPKVMGAERPSKLERYEHNIFEAWLIKNNYAYRHSRTDKRTREKCGAPDFTVYAKPGRVPVEAINCCLAIEFKLPGNRLSKAQEAWAKRYGAVLHVLASADEAIALVKAAFGTPKH